MAKVLFTSSIIESDGPSFVYLESRDAHNDGYGKYMEGNANSIKLYYETTRCVSLGWTPWLFSFDSGQSTNPKLVISDITKFSVSFYTAAYGWVDVYHLPPK